MRFIQWIPLLVVGLLGCGEVTVVELDAGLDSGIVDDAASAGAGECTLQTYPQDCPVKECQVIVGCTLGLCEYGSFECGQAGLVCPVESCRATSSNGTVSNECIEIVAAPCGSGGSCDGNTCRLPSTALQLNGGLHNAQIQGTLATGLTLDGELSHSKPSANKKFSGTLILSGGLQN